MADSIQQKHWTARGKESDSQREDAEQSKGFYLIPSQVILQLLLNQVSRLRTNWQNIPSKWRWRHSLYIQRQTPFFRHTIRYLHEDKSRAYISASLRFLASTIISCNSTETSSERVGGGKEKERGIKRETEDRSRDYNYSKRGSAVQADKSFVINGSVQ